MRLWRSLLLPATLFVALAVPALAQTPPVDKPVPVPVAKPTAAAMPKKPKTSKPERRAWMFGFNAGYGGTRFVGNWVPVIGELRTDTPVETPPLLVGHHTWDGTKFQSAAVVQYRLGYMINPRVMIGFERLQWSKTFEGLTIRVLVPSQNLAVVGHTDTWHFSSSTVSATWYPGAAHLFFRGGAGLSSLTEKIPVIDPQFIDASDRGVSLEGAVGWERVVFDRVSIAPEVSVRQMNFGHAIRSQIAAGSLALNWWF